MKIDWNEKSDGINMLELREFLKRAISNNELTITRLSNIIYQETRRALRQAVRPNIEAVQQEVETNCKQYIETLIKLGYIETITEPDFGTHYRRTITGSAFAMAGPKRYSRKAAQRQLDEFLSRCRELNALSPNINAPETICQVDSVIVYGSFATNETTDVGDVDLCVTLSTRDQDKFLAYTRQSFHVLGLDAAIRLSPEILALKKLRKGLNILSVGTSLPPDTVGKCLLKRNDEVP